MAYQSKWALQGNTSRNGKQIRRRIVLAAMSVGVISGLSACSYIKSFLPDKERDYHYSQQIPVLLLPEGIDAPKIEAIAAQEAKTSAAVITDPNKIQVQGLDSSVVTSDSNAVPEVVEETEQVADTLAEPQTIQDEGQELVAGAASAQLVTQALVEESTIDVQSETMPDNELLPVDDSVAQNAAAPVQPAKQDSAASVQKTDPWDINLDDEQAASATAGQTTSPDINAGQMPVEQGARSEQPQAKNTDKVRYVVFNDGSNRIQIEEDLKQTWRQVGKALSGNSIEITGRFPEEGLYTVQYESLKKEYQDGSIWDEFLFFFSGDQKNEQEFNIRILNSGLSYSEIAITDLENVPVKEGEGLKLLQSLFRALKSAYIENQAV